MVPVFAHAYAVENPVSSPVPLSSGFLMPIVQLEGRLQEAGPSKATGQEATCIDIIPRCCSYAEEDSS
jgi:hypothetical protein